MKKSADRYKPTLSISIAAAAAAAAPAAPAAPLMPLLLPEFPTWPVPVNCLQRLYIRHRDMLKMKINIICH